jgi:hypothetical protein
MQRNTLGSTASPPKRLARQSMLRRGHVTLSLFAEP